jgi:hypothetical protein
MMPLSKIYLLIILSWGMRWYWINSYQIEQRN